MTHRIIRDQLFDGRDILYFDDVASELAETRAPDTRDAAERPAVGTMRYDALSGEWISVAAHRQGRVFLPPAHVCPLCPASAENLSEVPANFDVAVFENKSPSFGPVQGLVSQLPAPGESKLGYTQPAFGRCEVVVFSPEHQGSLGGLPVNRVRTVVEAWAERTRELQQLPGIMQVFPFENRGQEIGVTLHHPHGQIYAYPYITPKTKGLLDQLGGNGHKFFEELLEFERNTERVLIASENFTAYVPWAARWPLEIHLLPHRNVNDLSQLTDDERDELADIHSRLLAGLDRLYDTPTPYIAAWHQAPIIEQREQVRLQLRIHSPRRAADKLKYLAGSESAMGAFIGDVAPETQAAQLREVVR